MRIHAETDDLARLLAILPPPLQRAAADLPPGDLVEIVLDLGRRPQARLTDAVVDLAGEPLGRAELDAVSARVGSFTADNRAGIEGTLHRIACLRNRVGVIVGLTLRVGRAVFGTIEAIRDLVEDGRSLLLLGAPGVGKTTRLREVARVLADEAGRRVVVIDTSNEIAGDGDVPHPAIGLARRMQVPHPERQHAVMIEAVENHMPEAIVVDEIGTHDEALAARTIAERGVQLIGTAHGTTLANLLQNPTLADLVGGVQTVTLSDEEARLRGTQKTVTERRRPPTFDAVVEIVGRDQVLVHRDTARAVDALLRGRPARGQLLGGDGEPAAEPEPPAPEPPPAPVRPDPGSERLVRIYPYALRRDSVDRVIRDLRLNARTVDRPERADLFISLRARADDPRLNRLAEASGAPVHSVKRNSTAQIRRTLRDLFNIVPGLDDDTVNEAAREAETAARQAQREGVAVELSPRPAPVRQLQHRIAVRHQLLAQSTGSEPDKHLVIQPPTTR